MSRACVQSIMDTKTQRAFHSRPKPTFKDIKPDYVFTEPPPLEKSRLYGPLTHETLELALRARWQTPDGKVAKVEQGYDADGRYYLEY